MPWDRSHWGPLDAGPDSPDPSSNLFCRLPCLREMGGGRGWPDWCACRLCLVLEGLLSPISLDSAGSSGSSLLPRPHTRPPPSHTVCEITRARSAGPHGTLSPSTPAPLTAMPLLATLFQVSSPFLPGNLPLGLQPHTGLAGLPDLVPRCSRPSGPQPHDSSGSYGQVMDGGDS